MTPTTINAAQKIADTIIEEVRVYSEQTRGVDELRERAGEIRVLHGLLLTLRTDLAIALRASQSMEGSFAYQVQQMRPHRTRILHTAEVIKGVCGRNYVNKFMDTVNQQIRHRLHELELVIM